jgi:putative ABC transport system permease protein
MDGERRGCQVRYHTEGPMAQISGLPITRRLQSAVKLAYESIQAHRLRSFLTLLGVILGVASVVVVGSAINGLSTYTADLTSKAFGTDAFLVAQIAQVGNVTRKEIAEKLRYNRDISFQELEYLKTVNGDRVLYSTYDQRVRDVRSGEQLFENALILGAGAALPDIRDVPLAEGRFYTEQEERNKQALCVIGRDIKERLFPTGETIGRSLRISGIDFRVIGIQETQGSSFGQSLDNQVYIPATLFGKMFGGRLDVAIFGRARPETGMTMDEAVDLTRSALRSRFKTRPGKPDNFDTLTPDAVRGFVDQIIGLISAIVIPVTCISLVVGGIVIMNIMLVSVTERTREIGIRKSIGARSGDIQMQVLLEAMILSLAGGVFGIIVAWVLSVVLSKLLGTTIEMSRNYILLGVFVSTGVGLISGWYPAMRAAKLDPIVALRQE